MDTKTTQTLFILSYGWVLLAEITETTSSEICVKDVSVLRRWGTNEGLGELVAKGVLTRTKTDWLAPAATLSKAHVLFSCPAGELRVTQ